VNLRLITAPALPRPFLGFGQRSTLAPYYTICSILPKYRFRLFPMIAALLVSSGIPLCRCSVNRPRTPPDHVQKPSEPHKNARRLLPCDFSPLASLIPVRDVLPLTCRLAALFPNIPSRPPPSRFTTRCHLFFRSPRIGRDASLHYQKTFSLPTLTHLHSRIVILFLKKISFTILRRFRFFDLLSNRISAHLLCASLEHQSMPAPLFQSINFQFGRGRKLRVGSRFSEIIFLNLLAQQAPYTHRTTRNFTVFQSMRLPYL